MDESYLRNLRARLDPAYHAPPSLPSVANGPESAAHGSRDSLPQTESKSLSTGQMESGPGSQQTGKVEEPLVQVTVEGSDPGVTRGEERKKERRRVRRTRKRTESVQQESVPDEVEGAASQEHQLTVASGDKVDNQDSMRQLPGQFNVSLSYPRISSMYNFFTLHHQISFHTTLYVHVYY